MNDDEPRRFTRTDLAALAVGGVLALAFGWYTNQTSLQTLGGKPAPGWFVALMYFQEAIHKGCLAMIPVIVSRRLQYGGRVRSAEFLTLTVGLSNLFLGLQSWPIIGVMSQAAGDTVGYRLNRENYHIWVFSQTACGLVAALVVVAFRRFMTAWVVDLMVGFVWYELLMVQYFESQWLEATYATMNLAPATKTLMDLAAGLPFSMIGNLPLVAAMVDLGRSGRRRRTWVEWAGLTVLPGVVWRGLVEFGFFAERLSWGGWTGVWDVRNFRALAFLATIAVDLAIVLRYGPAWRRWRDGDDRPALVSHGRPAMMKSSPGT